uniref:Uncharacterized protein n=1 Tax=Ditylenchus dipsaci TaxID=166011 RepID=A0A915EK41_9BILA
MCCVWNSSNDVAVSCEQKSGKCVGGRVGVRTGILFLMPAGSLKTLSCFLLAGYRIPARFLFEKYESKWKFRRFNNEEGTSDSPNLSGEKLRVVVYLEEPFVMRKYANIKGATDTYEGFCIDLLQEMANTLNFTFEIVEVEDGTYGVEDETGRWNGIIGVLQRHEADLSVSAVTITYSRVSVIDFTLPFMHLGIAILVSKNLDDSAQSSGLVGPGSSTLFTFLEPLSFSVWVCLGIAYFSVACMMWFLARFSPYEWFDDVQRLDREDKRLKSRKHKNQFNLLNSLWFAVGSLMQQGSDVIPRAAATRTVAVICKVCTLFVAAIFSIFMPYATFIFAKRKCTDKIRYATTANSHFCVFKVMVYNIEDVIHRGEALNIYSPSFSVYSSNFPAYSPWAYNQSSKWMFTLILISSYTAQLAAFLTVERMTTPVESSADLASQQRIKFGTLRNGSTMDFFRESKIPIYERMWSIMQSTSPTVFVNSSKEGIARVKAGNYAYMMESSMLEFYMGSDCNLQTVGGLLDSKGYGVALPKGSPLRDIFSKTILQLQERTILEGLKNKWWNKQNSPHCHAVSNVSHSSLQRVFGIFYVLFAGIIVALLMAAGEFCIESKTQSLRLGLTWPGRFFNWFNSIQKANLNMGLGISRSTRLEMAEQPRLYGSTHNCGVKMGAVNPHHSQSDALSHMVLGEGPLAHYQQRRLRHLEDDPSLSSNPNLPWPGGRESMAEQSTVRIRQSSDAATVSTTTAVGSRSITPRTSRKGSEPLAKRKTSSIPMIFSKLSTPSITLTVDSGIKWPDCTD